MSPTKKEIKAAWDRWNRINVSRYHDSGCMMLRGSRPEDGDCSCGLIKAERRKDAAWEVLNKMMKGIAK